MSMFKGKKDKVKGKSVEAGQLDPNYKPKGYFHIGSPFGYVPQEVDETIQKFNDLLANQKKIIIRMKEESMSQKAEIQRLENELQNMQMEMSFATIPQVTDIQEEYILNRFDEAFQSDENRGGMTADQRMQAQREAVTRQNPAPVGQGSQAQQSSKMQQVSQPTDQNDETTFDIDGMLAETDKQEEELFVASEGEDTVGDEVFDIAAILGESAGIEHSSENNGQLEIADSGADSSDGQEVFDIPGLSSSNSVEASQQQQKQEESKPMDDDDFASKFQF